jgi:hypothetical protein
MAPQWFKDLLNAYLSRNLNQDVLNMVRENIQSEYALPAKEALDLLRQALGVISSGCRSASACHVSLSTFTASLRRS